MEKLPVTIAMPRPSISPMQLLPPTTPAMIAGKAVLELFGAGVGDTGFGADGAGDAVGGVLMGVRGNLLKMMDCSIESVNPSHVDHSQTTAVAGSIRLYSHVKEAAQRPQSRHTLVRHLPLAQVWHMDHVQRVPRCCGAPKRIDVETRHRHVHILAQIGPAAQHRRGSSVVCAARLFVE